MARVASGSCRPGGSACRGAPPGSTTTSSLPSIRASDPPVEPSIPGTIAISACATPVGSAAAESDAASSCSDSALDVDCSADRCERRSSQESHTTAIATASATSQRLSPAPSVASVVRGGASAKNATNQPMPTDANPGPSPPYQAASAAAPTSGTYVGSSVSGSSAAQIPSATAAASAATA